MSTTTNPLDNTTSVFTCSGQLNVGTSGTTAIISQIRSASGQWVNFNDQTDSFGDYNNAGSPEGVVAANIGSLCRDTTNGDLYIKKTDTVNTGWLELAQSGFNSINIQTFTSGGTYTPTTGMAYCIIEVLGGGGGSGATTTTGGAQVSAVAGGGAGGYARKVVAAATIGASQTVTIGAAGAAGTVPGGAGGNGGTSSVGAIVSATGGTGSAGSAAANQVYAAGGAGGTGASGDINLTGESGQPVIARDGMTTITGRGGNSLYGVGGITQSNGDAPIAGSAASGFGAGGGGGNILAVQTQLAGGAGTAGYVVITEYIAT